MEPIPIQFTNKKTGQVLKFNTPQEALDYGFSPEKVQSKLEATKKVQTTVETGDPFAFETQQAVSLQQAKAAAEEETSRMSAQKEKATTIGLVDTILERDTGAITGVRNPFKYLTGENQYTKNLVDQLTSSLSVDAREKMKGTGQISDFESKLLAKSVSALNTNLSNKDFQTELNRIRNILSDKEADAGLEEGGGKGIIESLLSPLITTAGNVGALGQVGLSSLVGKFNPQAGAQLAQEGRGVIGGELAKRQRMASEQPLQAVGEQAGASAELALPKLLGMAGRVPAVAKATGAVKGVAGRAVPSTIKNILNPIGALGESRTAAGATAEAGGKALSNDKILKGVTEKIAKSGITESKKKAAIQIAENAFKKGGKTGIQESIGEFSNAVGYTKGGSALRSAEGQYAVALRNTLKEIWQKESPEVLKITGQMAKTFQVQKGVGKTLRNVGALAGGIGGALYLKDLLSGRGRSDND